MRAALFALALVLSACAPSQDDADQRVAARHQRFMRDLFDHYTCERLSGLVEWDRLTGEVEACHYETPCYPTDVLMVTVAKCAGLFTLEEAENLMFGDGTVLRGKVQGKQP